MTTANSTVIASCTERDFLETILPYDRRGDWACVYCGEAISYPANGSSVYLGPSRLECVIESLHGYRQLRPRYAAPSAANRCCSDRIARADSSIALGRSIECPICGDAYLSAMVPRWGGSAKVKGYTKNGYAFSVDTNLMVPALVPVERLTSRE